MTILKRKRWVINMKRSYKALIFGIFLSVIGIILMASTAVFAYNDYKNYDKFKEGTLELTEDLDYSFEVSAGTVNFFKTEDASHVDYKIIDLYEVKLNDKTVTVGSKRKFFSFGFLAYKNVVNVYLNENISDNNCQIKLSAGKINMNDDFEFESLKITVSAGELLTKKIVTNDKLDIAMSAGDMKISDSKTNKLDVKISAGDIDLKSDFNSLEFKISAGDFDLDAYGNEADYTIDVKVSAGNSNARNGGSGEKKIKGSLSAGDFTIKYLG